MVGVGRAARVEPFLIPSIQSTTYGPPFPWITYGFPYTVSVYQ